MHEAHISNVKDNFHIQLYSFALSIKIKAFQCECRYIISEYSFQIQFARILYALSTDSISSVHYIPQFYLEIFVKFNTHNSIGNDTKKKTKILKYLKIKSLFIA